MQRDQSLLQLFLCTIEPEMTCCKQKNAWSSPQIFSYFSFPACHSTPNQSLPFHLNGRHIEKKRDKLYGTLLEHQPSIYRITYLQSLSILQGFWERTIYIYHNIDPLVVAVTIADLASTFSSSFFAISHNSLKNLLRTR